MKFKVGDKVKFLDEAGGGVVSRIISTSMVSVAIEDGFEIPVLSSELVKVENTGHAGEMFSEDFNVALPALIGNETHEENDRVSKLERSVSSGVNEPGVYLAYHPHDQNWLVTGMMDIFIINNTPVDILFSIFFRDTTDGPYIGTDYGSLLPYTKYLVETVSHEKAGQWNKGALQILFHKEKASQLAAPVSTEFNIKLSRFASESSYQFAAFLQGQSLLMRVADIPKAEAVKKEKPDTETTEVLEKKAVQARQDQLIDRYRTARDEAVVDLHIGKVVDDLSGLSPHDMLNAQINHFIKCLENAMENKYRKVTFIHGVGNGTLKEAIIEKMKEYENLKDQSASLAKFGVGAVDILINYSG